MLSHFTCEFEFHFCIINVFDGFYFFLHYFKRHILRARPRTIQRSTQHSYELCFIFNNQNLYCIYFSTLLCCNFLICLVCFFSGPDVLSDVHAKSGTQKIKVLQKQIHISKKCQKINQTSLQSVDMIL